MGNSSIHHSTSKCSIRSYQDLNAFRPQNLYKVLPVSYFNCQAFFSQLSSYWSADHFENYVGQMFRPPDLEHSDDTSQWKSSSVPHKNLVGNFYYGIDMAYSMSLRNSPYSCCLKSCEILLCASKSLDQNIFWHSCLAKSGLPICLYFRSPSWQSTRLDPL